jgi:hypothetical protein
MQQPTEVVMGPCVRRDDDEERQSPSHRQLQLHRVFRDDDLAGEILRHVPGPVVVGDEGIIAGYEMTPISEA